MYMTEISLIVTLNNQFTPYPMPYSLVEAFEHIKKRWPNRGILSPHYLGRTISPWGRRGFKSRIRPPYPQRVVKGD